LGNAGLFSKVGYAAKVENRLGKIVQQQDTYGDTSEAENQVIINVINA